jgi:hypothetical protein
MDRGTVGLSVSRMEIVWFPDAGWSAFSAPLIAFDGRNPPLFGG